MLGKALVDCPVNLLAHMASEALSALAAGRGEFLDAFLFQAIAEFGLAAAFLAVTLLAFSQFAMKGAVVLAIRSSHKVSNAHIHADHRGLWFSLERNDFIVGEGQPPAIPTLVEDHARVDGLARKRLAMVRRQLDRDKQLFAEFEGADFEPAVKGGVLRGFEDNDVGVGLDAGLV